MGDFFASIVFPLRSLTEVTLSRFSRPEITSTQAPADCIPLASAPLPFLESKENQFGAMYVCMPCFENIGIFCMSEFKKVLSKRMSDSVRCLICSSLCDPVPAACDRSMEPKNPARNDGAVVFVTWDDARPWGTQSPNLNPILRQSGFWKEGGSAFPKSNKPVGFF